MASGAATHPGAGYPAWMPKPRCPVTVIIGPPGNGALAFAVAHARPGEVIIDLESIITEISGVPAPKAGPEWIVPALRQRNEALQVLSTPAAPDAAWLISPAPKAWQRRFWQDVLGATIVLRDPGREAAILAARDAGVSERWVHQWYAEAEATGGAHDFAAAPAGPREAASKRGYGKGEKTQSHSKMRDAQLLREPTCRFCREERGQAVPATVLDHIQPFRKASGDIDFKLWGDPKNHRSLCKPCHDARGATSRRDEKPPGAASDGRPLDPAHPWNRAKL